MDDIGKLLHMSSFKAKSWYLDFIRVNHPHWNESTAPGIYDRFLFALRFKSITGQHLAAAMALPKTFARLREQHNCSGTPGMIGSLVQCETFGRVSLLGYPTVVSPPMNVRIPYLAMEHRTLELLHRVFDVKGFPVNKADYQAILRAIVSCTQFLCDERSEIARPFVEGPKEQIAMLQAFLRNVVHLCIATLQSAHPIHGDLVSIVASQAYVYRPDWLQGCPAPPRVEAGLRATIEELLLQLQWIPGDYFTDFTDKFSLSILAMEGLERLKQEREADGESLPFQGVPCPFMSEHERTWETVLEWLKNVGAANF
ncbi:hypothetical protein CC79DRAFT_181594 [Sarocladium strictum]